MTISKRAQELLIGASKIIADKNNWASGTLYTSNDDKVCSLGAVYKAADDIRVAHGKNRKWLRSPLMRRNPVIKEALKALSASMINEMPEGHKKELLRPQISQPANDMFPYDMIIAGVNDTSGYEAVRKAFCRAVKDHCLPPEEPNGNQ